MLKIDIFYIKKLIIIIIIMMMMMIMIMIVFRLLKNTIRLT